MNSRYGEDLQEFLLDNYKIETVLQFASEAFDDALIGSTVIIAEKCEDESERNQNRVKFLKVYQRMSLEDVASVVEMDVDADKTVITDEYWMLAATQSTTRHNSRWSLYYDTPPVYFDLLRGDDICELQEVANLYKGQKVGGNDYFYRRTEEWEELGLEEYTYPAIKATGQINKIRFDESDAEEWGVLDVRDLVTAAFESDRQFGDNDLDHMKKWLGKNGYSTLLEFIEQGEDDGHHGHDYCERRDIWFHLGDIGKYSSIMTMGEFLWTNHRVIWNEADALVDYQFHCIEPKNNINDKVLAGILNSRVTWLARELEGRKASGASMTRARMTLYEAKEMSLVDPRRLHAEDQEAIAKAFDALLNAEEKADEPDEDDVVDRARDELDRAVLTAIGEEGKFEEVKQAVEKLVQIRSSEGSDNTEVLIDRDQQREVIELEGVESARESTRLDDFQ